MSVTIRSSSVTKRRLMNRLRGAIPCVFLLFLFLSGCGTTPTEHVELGKNKQQQDYYQEAISEYNKAIRKKPRFAKAYYLRGKAKRSSGDLDGAIKDFNEATNLDPVFQRDVSTLGMAYFHRGKARHKQGNSSGANRDWKKALEVLPEVSDLHDQLEDQIKKLKKNQ